MKFVSGISRRNEPEATWHHSTSGRKSHLNRNPTAGAYLKAIAGLVSCISFTLRVQNLSLLTMSETSA